MITATELAAEVERDSIRRFDQRPDPESNPEKHFTKIKLSNRQIVITSVYWLTPAAFVRRKSRTFSMFADDQ